MSTNFLSIKPTAKFSLQLDLTFLGDDQISSTVESFVLEAGSTNVYTISHLEGETLVSSTGKIMNIYQYSESRPIQGYSGGISSLTYEDFTGYKIILDTSTLYASATKTIDVQNIRKIVKVDTTVN